MSDISFETNNQIKFKNIASLSQKESKGIINFLINKGVVKDIRGANVLLSTMSVFLFILTICVCIYYFSDLSYRNKDNLKKIEAVRENIIYIKSIKK